MERLIINEGQGGRPSELVAAFTSVGSDPACDIVLAHPAADGCRFVIERTPTGHRVRLQSGELFHNEQPCLVADLVHNDTLRVGESLVLYKNPAATLPTAATHTGPAVVTARPHSESGPAPAPVAELEEPADLEELEELSELDELEEIEELEAPPAPVPAGLRESRAPPALQPLDVPEAAALEELQVLEEQDAVEVLEPLEALETLEDVEGLEAPEESETLEQLADLEVLAAPPPARPAVPDQPAASPVGEQAAPGQQAPAPSRSAAGAPSPAPERVPATGIRFRRPLPAGRRGPSFLPPAHPGQRPR